MMNETGVESTTANEQKPLSVQQINIPVDLRPHSQPPGLNLPILDLINGPREEYLRIGVPLYKASIKGDWKAAKYLLDRYAEMNLERYSITENGETSLHVAVSAKGSKKVEDFVEKLVSMMPVDDLTLQNKNHNTAFYLAAVAGNIKIVKMMAEKNRDLFQVPGAGGQMMPLYAAALFGHYEVAKYLYERSTDLCDEDGWTRQNRGWLLEKCVEADMFDIALKIVTRHRDINAGSIGNVLRILARKSKALSEKNSKIIWRTINSVFSVIGLYVGPPAKESDALQLLRIMWEDISKQPKKIIDDILRGPSTSIRQDHMRASEKIGQPTRTITYESRIMFVAAEMGNTEFLVELIRRYPDLTWKVNDSKFTIFHIAVKYRHEGIYNLLYEIGSMKDLIIPLRDQNDNTMLHLAGMCAKKKLLEDVSGAALQMQRELLWFQEVERMMPPSYRDRQNKNGLTARELFSQEHTSLIIEGERWMKETASQCMVVAALIATIVFAAAFTVPGGYDQDNGIPIFYKKLTFVVFVVADAISLFLSSTSILTFLSILTSRYAERDFLESLPKKLMLGLVTLFLSITTMMITFSVSFFILYHKQMKWIPIVLCLFAVSPVLLYVTLQYHVLVDVVRSTYGSKYLFKPEKQVLFYENPMV